jgi:RNA polymerase sigma-70 factor, ECF subfamily
VTASRQEAPRQTPEAFIGTLYAAFAESVRSRIRRAGVEGPDVEDLCQSVFLIALRRQKRVSRDFAFAGPWLLCVARKHAANYHRLYRHKHEIHDSDAIDRAFAEPSDPEAALALQILVHKSGRKLNITDRDTLNAYHMDGESLADLAKLQGLPKAGAHVRVTRAEAEFARILRHEEENRSR